MPNKETLIKDLNDICQQTNGLWLCCSDIYTPDIEKDESQFLAAFQSAGFLKKDVLFHGYAALEYGGGLRFNYKDVIEGGYTLCVPQKHKALVIFSGFETDFDQITIYHECAHLFQRKHDLFGSQKEPNNKYIKYLKEVHANTFASMVMLLRAEDMLTFKKQQLSRVASDVQTVNHRTQKNIYYISLPITLELLKSIRREGRMNALQKFSQNGTLDFEKIAFYTADFVKKYAYTDFEFHKIMDNQSFSSYDALKRKAKAWHILGERYVAKEKEKEKKQEREIAYLSVTDQRNTKTQNKIKPLPETDEKSKIINAVCTIDILNTRLSQDFNIYTSLDYLIKKNVFCFRNLKDEQKKEALKICDQIAEIYQKWHKNLFFKKLFSKINHPDTRDEVWTLKQKKEREILYPIIQSQYKR